MGFSRTDPCLYSHRSERGVCIVGVYVDDIVCANLGCMLHEELVMCVDNTAAIDIAQNMGVTARTKHFTDAIHYFRDLVDRKCMLPVHVFTDRQRADGFTNPLPRHYFLDWVDTLVH